jgi:hypothetical protein
VDSNKGRNPRPSVRPTFVEDISILDASARMAPIGLQLYAADFLSAAKAAPPPDIPPFAPARTYLVCHALELALKAFLSLKGRSLKRLAGVKFRHDLESLLTKAEQNGLPTLVTLEEHHKFQIRRASSYYADKVFEYPAVFEAMRCYPEYPDTAVLISAAEILIPVLREPCLNAD